MNIAVFIDFDNIEIGVKNTLGQQFDVGTVLEAIKERGEIVSKIAYADWTRAGDYSRHLTQHAVRLVQRNLTPGGDKNGADINMALDALEMAFTHQHINAYVIVGGDSDFLSLVEKLKQYDKKVFIVGGRAFTSMILQKNCHEFIAYENLHGVRTAPPRGHADVAAAAGVAGRSADRAGVSDREARAQDPGRPRSVAADGSAQEHAAAARLDVLGTQLRLVVVPRFRREALAGGPRAAEDIGPQRDGGAQSGFRRGRTRCDETADLKVGTTTDTDVVQAFRPADAGFRPASQRAADAPAQTPAPAPQATASNADGVQLVGDALRAATSARWPMYIRNVKQMLRAADSSFDERRYGFGGLMDLLRACQRDGLMRLERDRRGGLRVFPGASLQQGSTPRAVQAPVLPQPDVAYDDTAETDYQPPVETAVSPMRSKPTPIRASRSRSTRRPNCWAGRRHGGHARREPRRPEARARARARSRSAAKDCRPAPLAIEKERRPTTTTSATHN